MSVRQDSRIKDIVRLSDAISMFPEDAFNSALDPVFEINSAIGLVLKLICTHENSVSLLLRSLCIFTCHLQNMPTEKSKQKIVFIESFYSSGAYHAMLKAIQIHQTDLKLVQISVRTLLATLDCDHEVSIKVADYFVFSDPFGLLINAIKASSHSKIKNEYLVLSILALLLRVKQVLKDKIERSTRTHMIDVIAQSMFSFSKIPKVISISLHCLDAICSTEHPIMGLVNTSALGVISNVIAQSKRSSNARFCANAKETLFRLYASISDSQVVEYASLDTIIARALHVFVGEVVFTEEDKEALKRIMPEIVDDASKAALQLSQQFSIKDGVFGFNTARKQKSVRMLWLLSISVMHSAFANQFTDAGGLVHIFNIVVRESIAQDADLAYPASIALLHTCVTIGEQAYNYVCRRRCEIVSTLLKAIIANFGKSSDEYNAHIIHTIKSFCRCQTSVEDMQTLASIDIFSAMRILPEQNSLSLQAFVELLAHMYDLKIPLAGADTRVWADTITEHRMRLAEATLEYHVVTLKALLCIYTEGELLCPRKAIKEIMRLYRKKAGDEEVCHHIVRLLFLLFENEDVKIEFVDQGVLSVLCRSALELTIESGTFGFYFNTGLCTQQWSFLVHKAIKPAAVEEYVRVLDSLGDLGSSREEKEHEKCSDSASYEAYIESLELTCSVLGSLCCVTECHQTFSKMQVIRNLSGLVLKQIETMQPLNSFRWRALRCCFFAMDCLISLHHPSDSLVKPHIRDACSELKSFSTWRLDASELHIHDALIISVNALLDMPNLDHENLWLLCTIIRITFKMATFDPLFMNLMMDRGWLDTATSLLKMNLKLVQSHVLQCLLIGISVSNSWNSTTTLISATVVKKWIDSDDGLTVFVDIFDQVCINSLGEKARCIASCDTVQLFIRCLHTLITQSADVSFRLVLRISTTLNHILKFYMFAFTTKSSVIVLHCQKVIQFLATRERLLTLSRVILQGMNKLMRCNLTASSREEHDVYLQEYNQLNLDATLLVAALKFKSTRDIFRDASLHRLLMLAAEFIATSSFIKLSDKLHKASHLSDLVLLGSSLICHPQREEIQMQSKEFYGKLSVSSSIHVSAIMLANDTFELLDFSSLRDVVQNIVQKTHENTVHSEHYYALLFLCDIMRMDNRHVFDVILEDLQIGTFEFAKHAADQDYVRHEHDSFLLILLGSWIRIRMSASGDLEGTTRTSRSVLLPWLNCAGSVLQWTLDCVHSYWMEKSKNLPQNEDSINLQLLSSLITQSKFVMVDCIKLNATFARAIIQHPLTKIFLFVLSQSSFVNEKVEYTEDIKSWIIVIFDYISTLHGSLIAERMQHLSPDSCILLFHYMDTSVKNVENVKLVANCFARALNMEEVVWMDGGNVIKCITEQTLDQGSVLAQLSLLYFRHHNGHYTPSEQQQKGAYPLYMLHAVLKLNNVKQTAGALSNDATSVQVIVLTMRLVLEYATAIMDSCTVEVADLIAEFLCLKMREATITSLNEAFQTAWMNLALYLIGLPLQSQISLPVLLDRYAVMLGRVCQYLFHSIHGSIHYHELKATAIRFVRTLAKLVAAHWDKQWDTASIFVIRKTLQLIRWDSDCCEEFLEELFVGSKDLASILSLLGGDQCVSADIDRAFSLYQEELILFAHRKLQSSIAKSAGTQEVEAILSVLDHTKAESISYALKLPHSILHRKVTTIASLELLKAFVRQKMCAIACCRMDGLETLYDIICFGSIDRYDRQVKLALEIICYLTGNSDNVGEQTLLSVFKILYVLMEYTNEAVSTVAYARLAFLIIDQCVTYASPMFTSRLAQECHIQVKLWSTKSTTQVICEESEQVITRLYEIMHLHDRGNSTSKLYSGPVKTEEQRRKNILCSFDQECQMLESGITRGHCIILKNAEVPSSLSPKRMNNLSPTSTSASAYVDLDSGMTFNTQTKPDWLPEFKVPKFLAMYCADKESCIAVPAPYIAFRNTLYDLNEYLYTADILVSPSTVNSLEWIVPALSTHIALQTLTTDVVILCLRVLARVTFLRPANVVSILCNRIHRYINSSQAGHTTFFASCRLHLTQSLVFANYLGEFCENTAPNYVNTSNNAPASSEQSKNLQHEFLRTVFLLVQSWPEDSDIVRSSIPVIWIFTHSGCLTSLHKVDAPLSRTNGSPSKSNITHLVCGNLNFWLDVMRGYAHDHFIIRQCFKCLEYLLVKNRILDHAYIDARTSETNSILPKLVAFLASMIRLHRRHTLIMKLGPSLLSTILDHVNAGQNITAHASMQIASSKDCIKILIDCAVLHVESCTVVSSCISCILHIVLYGIRLLEVEGSPESDRRGNVTAILEACTNQEFSIVLLQMSTHYAWVIMLQSQILEIIAHLIQLEKEHFEFEDDPQTQVLNAHEKLIKNLVSEPYATEVISAHLRRNIAALAERSRLDKAKEDEHLLLIELSLDILSSFIQTDEGRMHMENKNGLEIVRHSVDIACCILACTEERVLNKLNRARAILGNAFNCMVNLACTRSIAALMKWTRYVTWLLQTALRLKEQEGMEDRTSEKPQDSIYLLAIENIIGILTRLSLHAKFTKSLLPARTLSGGNNEHTNLITFREDDECNAHFIILKLLVYMDVASSTQKEKLANSDESRARRFIEIGLLNLILQLCHSQAEHCMYFIIYDGVPILLERISMHLNDPDRLKLSLGFLAIVINQDVDVSISLQHSDIRTILSLVLQLYDERNKLIVRSVRDMIKRLDGLDQNCIGRPTYISRGTNPSHTGVVPAASILASTMSPNITSQKVISMLSNSAVFRLRKIVSQVQSEGAVERLGAAETVLITLGYSAEYFLLRYTGNPRKTRRFLPKSSRSSKKQQQGTDAAESTPDRVWINQLAILPPVDLKALRQTERRRWIPVFRSKQSSYREDRLIHLSIRHEQILLEATSAEFCGVWLKALQALLARVDGSE